jgi:hypothetical protein
MIVNNAYYRRYYSLARMEKLATRFRDCQVGYLYDLWTKYMRSTFVHLKTKRPPIEQWVPLNTFGEVILDDVRLAAIGKALHRLLAQRGVSIDISLYGNRCYLRVHTRSYLACMPAMLLFDALPFFYSPDKFLSDLYTKRRVKGGKSKSRLNILFL